MLCGATSGAVTKTVVAPLERVKILLQLRGMGAAIKGLPESTHLLGVMRHIVVTEGVTSLFKGNLANVVRIVPVYGLKFSLNDRFRTLVREPGQTTRQLSTAQLMVAGTMGGLCQILVTYPLELVRTRLSLSTTSLEGAYSGIIDCLRGTVAKEGVKGLYKGITATIWSGAPYTGLQMTSYELVKRQLVRMPHIFVDQGSADLAANKRHADAHSASVTAAHDVSRSNVVHVPEFSHIPLVTSTNGSSSTSSTGTGQINMLGKLTAGGISGLVSQTLTYPGDTIRRRMQTNGMGGRARLYTTTWDCVRQVWQQEGPRAFMRGATTNVWRCVPGAAIQFAVYDTVMTLLGIAVD